MKAKSIGTSTTLGAVCLCVFVKYSVSSVEIIMRSVVADEESSNDNETASDCVGSEDGALTMDTQKVCT